MTSETESSRQQEWRKRDSSPFLTCSSTISSLKVVSSRKTVVSQELQLSLILQNKTSPLPLQSAAFFSSLCRDPIDQTNQLVGSGGLSLVSGWFTTDHVSS